MDQDGRVEVLRDGQPGGRDGYRSKGCDLPFTDRDHNQRREAQGLIPCPYEDVQTRVGIKPAKITKIQPDQMNVADLQFKFDATYCRVVLQKERNTLETTTRSAMYMVRKQHDGTWKVSGGELTAKQKYQQPGSSELRVVGSSVGAGT